jgi:hypothetical protein
MFRMELCQQVPNTPAVFAHVSAFEDFIKEGICKLSSHPPAECLGCGQSNVLGLLSVVVALFVGGAICVWSSVVEALAIHGETRQLLNRNATKFGSIDV